MWWRDVQQKQQVWKSKEDEERLVATSIESKICHITVGICFKKSGWVELQYERNSKRSSSEFKRLNGKPITGKKTFELSSSV